MGDVQHLTPWQEVVAQEIVDLNARMRALVARSEELRATVARLEWERQNKLLGGGSGRTS